jgi:hypothetical protein
MNPAAHGIVRYGHLVARGADLCGRENPSKGFGWLGFDHIADTDHSGSSGLRDQLQHPIGGGNAAELRFLEERQPTHIRMGEDEAIA